MPHHDEVNRASRLFGGPGEMRSLMQSLDWSRTPVGPIETWPQALISAIRILLASQYPMVLTWGPEFTQFYNDAYAKLIGTGHPAALGNDIRITLAEGWATLGPMIDTVMKTGIANWTPALPLLMERSGYREEAYFSVSHAPAENDAGEIVGMLAVCSEVTAQVVGERRLKLLRELGSTAGEARDPRTTSRSVMDVLSSHRLDIPFAAILLDEESGFHLAAETNCPETILTTLPLEIVFETGQSEWTSLPASAAPAGGLWQDPVRQVLLFFLEGRRGKPIGILVVGINPSRELDEPHRGFLELLGQQVAIALRNARAFEEERRRVEELAAIDKAKTDFFSNVSHEFRTPLTLMLGPLEEMLADDASALAARHADLALVHRNGLRLLRLVNTLLEFSRVEAKRAEPLLEPTDLSALTAEIVSSFRSAIDRAGLKLNLNLQPLPFPVRVDPEMWEKIVLNLVSNALKHTCEGEISVSIAGGPDGIFVTIEDTGSGITAEALPRIFDRFQRGEAHNARSFEGTGIGLALVKELVGLHGGTISVESELGVGSRFVITLPVTLFAPGVLTGAASFDHLSRRAYAEEAARWSDSGTVSNQDDRSLPKILLADDNADMRDYIARLLHGICSVSTARDGQAGLEAIMAGTFDLVLTDVMMPQLDGFGLIRELRRNPTTAAIPVIMLSARAGEDSRIEGIEAGADDYLVKPFSARELVARVRANLELSRMRRDLVEAEARINRLEAIGQLTGGVAHDFNNLLTAVTGSLELLARRVADRPDLMRLVGLAQSGAARGAKLTGQLLAFARRQPLAPKLVDVNMQLREFMPLLRGAVGDAVELIFKPAATVQACNVDPSQLEVAVLNLLINARDASSVGNKVSIEISEIADDGQLFTCIAVKDQGHGMTAEVRARAVEPFFTTKDIGAGTGLGLSQVYGFAEQSGGRLEIDSVVEAGTTVRILLPRSSKAADTLDVSETEMSRASDQVILLVEDEEAVREIAAEVLRDAGFAIVEASNGHEALAKIRSGRRLDFVLTDVSMPKGMSGVDLAAEIRRLRPELPVLLTSGFAEVLRRDDHGFPLMPKPYSGTELLRRIHAMLENT